MCVRKKLHRYNVTSIWHFTDKRNLPGIRKAGGLLPRSRLVEDYVPSGNQWSIDADDMAGMDEYVHLCFLRKHPMCFIATEEGRIDPVWLQISTAVLDLPDVLYCAGVSNESGATYLSAQEAMVELDFDHMFRWHDFSIERNRSLHNQTQKYEILVPEVPVGLITEGL